MTHTDGKINHFLRLEDLIVLKSQNSLVAQWVKGLAFSLLWLGFNPWLGNFCMPWAQPKYTHTHTHTHTHGHLYV